MKDKMTADKITLYTVNANNMSIDAVTVDKISIYISKYLQNVY